MSSEIRAPPSRPTSSRMNGARLWRGRGRAAAAAQAARLDESLNPALGRDLLTGLVWRGALNGRVLGPRAPVLVRSGAFGVAGPAGFGRRRSARPGGSARRGGLVRP